MLSLVLSLNDASLGFSAAPLLARAAPITAARTGDVDMVVTVSDILSDTMSKEAATILQCYHWVSANAAAPAASISPEAVPPGPTFPCSQTCFCSSTLLSLSTFLQNGRRVVVTGMGVVSCLGNTLDDVAKSLHECKSGIKFNEEYVEKGMKSHVSGRPDIDCDSLIDRKQTRFMGENCKYAFLAMQQAIEDSGLTPEQIATPRVGGILGQGGTSVPDIDETLQAVNAGKNRRIGPYRVTRSMGSTVSAVLSTAFKLQGVSYSISSACSTGAHCIGVGMEQIQLGKQDICFCGAGEGEGWGFSVMFDSMGALSTKYNDSPETASRAFDKTRDGFVIAGGGGIVCVEELEHAKARTG